MHDLVVRAVRVELAEALDVRVENRDRAVRLGLEGLVLLQDACHAFRYHVVEHDFHVGRLVLKGG